MIYKKKYLLLTFFLIIIIQTLLYVNNKQKTSFRYLKWSVEEISIGKLISFSFLSGFFVSSILNTTNTVSYKNNTFEDLEDNDDPLDNDVVIKSNVQMPPQRDIRDSQPTISVNYRVVKNTEETSFNKDQNYSNKSYNKDDWDNDDNDW